MSSLGDRGTRGERADRPCLVVVECFDVAANE
jgi:hypothetical protein